MEKQNILLDMSSILKSYEMDRLNQIDFQSVKLSPSEKNILIFLANNQLKTPAKIAEALGVSKALITRGIKALAEKQLISQNPSKHDRRYLEIQLTAAGQQLAKECRSIRYEFIQQLTAKISNDELITFTKVLAKMVNNIQK